MTKLTAGELRIGNWINFEPFKDAGFEIIQVAELPFKKRNNVKAIPLTEDWLLRAGLKHEDGKFKTTNWSGLYFVWKSQWHLMRSTNNGDIEICYGIKTVHRAQNLIHSLTGQELVFRK